MIDFIADLHLSPATPGIARIFADFSKRIARPGHALYILGDFFEYWAGDEQKDLPFYRQIVAQLAQAADAGLAIFVMHGNRDFLLGEDFARAAKVRLIPDPFVLKTQGRRLLLSHGDALCTDDLAYQKFRQLVRSAEWQAAFLAKPLPERLAIAESLREQSESRKPEKALAYLDVNATAAEQVVQATQAHALIHGHTHRPADHPHQIDGHLVIRHVLADWHEDQGEALVLKAGQFEREILR
ncbi:MAG: UDP-2,3-diacylglucosamine diphosphatase [Zoogloeaceae bacterium]|nr:UDP-2,3-diacylglucosamine diphosphatase [Zoogloeaceae bacterium]